MEDEKRGFFNSPVIQRNTPIKRLGLSRKRKSCGSDCSLNAKIPACSEKISDSPSLTQNFHKGQNNNEEQTTDSNPASDYDEKIKTLKEKIAEQEKKIQTLKCSKSNILQLENLTELWKNGCKNAYLHFIKLLEDHQEENINMKAVLNKLGIWETMIDNFESDTEISLLD